MRAQFLDKCMFQPEQITVINELRSRRLPGECRREPLPVPPTKFFLKFLAQKLRTAMFELSSHEITFRFAWH
jgi:hypothetical protein